MKQVISLFFSILVFGISHAQILDSAFIRIAYTFEFKPDSTKNIKSDDLLIMECGKKASVCYSYYRFLRDSLIAGQFSEQQRIGATKFSINLNGFNKNGISRKFYRNTSNSTVTVTDQLLHNNYMYIDSCEELKWLLSNDKMTILGYQCLKAQTNFRGREYTAWFSDEIPLPFGPMKFGGLPGVILLLIENNDNFIFRCQSIEKLEVKVPIQIDKKQYSQTTRIGYKKLVTAMMENPDIFLEGSGMKITTISTTVPIEPRKIVSNPMELN